MNDDAAMSGPCPAADNRHGMDREYASFGSRL
jgi:hypothetical protein